MLLNNYKYLRLKYELSYSVDKGGKFAFCHIMETSCLNGDSFMTNSEILMRGIFGASRADIRPIACAVDVVGELLFEQGYSMDDILVTKHVYPDVARRLGKKSCAVTKSLERLTRLCWDIMSEHNLAKTYIGRNQLFAPTPRDLLVYLAVYGRLGLSFFELTEGHKELFFHSPANIKFAKLSKQEGSSASFELESEPPLLMIFKLSDGYTVAPVCRACMVILEQERIAFCNSCGRCMTTKLEYTGVGKA